MTICPKLVAKRNFYSQKIYTHTRSPGIAGGDTLPDRLDYLQQYTAGPEFPTEGEVDSKNK